MHILSIHPYEWRTSILCKEIEYILRKHCYPMREVKNPNGLVDGWWRFPGHILRRRNFDPCFNSLSVSYVTISCVSTSCTRSMSGLRRGEWLQQLFTNFWTDLGVGQETGKDGRYRRQTTRCWWSAMVMPSNGTSSVKHSNKNTPNEYVSADKS